MIKAPQDFWAGLLFVAAGLFVLIAGRDYPVGTASRMAIGYFPNVLGWALCVIGGLIAIRALMVHGASAPRFALRPLLPLVAVAAFGCLLQPAGLVVATIALIVVSNFGSDRFRPLDALGLTLVLVPFNWFVFVWALGLPLPVFPWT